MRTGVYCGSFNPVHKGHIKIVRTALRRNLLDRVLIVPTGNYWDKQNLPPVKDRINMLKFFENDRIMIDETHNDIQYTYQLFRALKQEYPDDQLVLIIGRDNIPTFDRWREYRELLQYDFIRFVSRVAACSEPLIIRVLSKESHLPFRLPDHMM